jgi:hypothetical protein
VKVLTNLKKLSLNVRCVSAYIKIFTAVGHIQAILCCVTYVTVTVLLSSNTRNYG